MPLSVARGHIGHLVEQGVVHKTGKDLYAWGSPETTPPPAQPKPPLPGEPAGRAEAILKALEGKPEGLSSQEIADAIGEKKKANLKRPLLELIESGQVIRLGAPGNRLTRYRLTKYGTSG